MINVIRPPSQALDEALRAVLLEKAKEETQRAVDHYIGELTVTLTAALEAASALKAAIIQRAAGGPEPVSAAADQLAGELDAVIEEMKGVRSDPDPRTIVGSYSSSLPKLSGLRRQLAAFRKEAAREGLDLSDIEKLTARIKPKLKAFGNFKVYKEDQLVAKLKEVFHEKCAYCESSFAHVSPADIEHFRPKSAVQIAEDTKSDEALEFKPGYYWLAADWDNLLLSCIDCNRRRYQATAGEEGPVASGKSTIFPLSDEGVRVRDHETWQTTVRRRIQNRSLPPAEDPIAREEQHRLLLDPCRDRPEEHLAFELEYRAAEEAGAPEMLEAVLAVARSPRGSTSINVYGLNRTALVLERKREALELQNDFFALIVATKGYFRMRKMEAGLRSLEKQLTNIPSQGTRTELLQLTTTLLDDAAKAQQQALTEIEQAIAFIRSKLAPDRPYLAMKRAIIEKEILQWPPMQEMLALGMFTEMHIRSLLDGKPLPIAEP